MNDREWFDRNVLIPPEFRRQEFQVAQVKQAAKKAKLTTKVADDGQSVRYTAELVNPLPAGQQAEWNINQHAIVLAVEGLSATGTIAHGAVPTRGILVSIAAMDQTGMPVSADFKAVNIEPGDVDHPGTLVIKLAGNGKDDEKDPDKEPEKDGPTESTPKAA